MQQINSSVYVEREYEGPNVGCIRTDEGLILIDTPVRPRDARTWRARVTQLTAQQTRYVINTKHHPHQLLINHFFAPAPVIAHQTAWDQINNWSDNQRQRLLESLKGKYAEEIGIHEKIQLIQPQLTLTNRMILHCGDKTLRLFYLRGYSPTSIGVYLPEEELFFSGDAVVNGRHPDMREAHTGQWLQDLTEIRRLRIKTLIPGRGPLCTGESTQQLSAYIRLLRRRVRFHMKDDRGWKETVNSIDIEEFLDFFPLEASERAILEKRIRMNLRRVYEESRMTEKKET